MKRANSLYIGTKRQLDILCTIIRWKPLLYHLGRRSIIKRTKLVNNSKAIFIGDYTTIESGAVLSDLNCGVGINPKIRIGNGCVFLFRFQCNSAKSVIIGDNVLCASNVLITDSDHVVEKNGLPVTKNNKFNTSPVLVEDNCWIGQNAVILKGVTVGKNSIIGANSVVTKDVPPCSVVCGNPAKIIKYL